MRALIVAAGFGSRLRAVSPSKPLTPVAGVPLIERVIRAAQRGGATGFVVVTGHEAARLEAFLQDLAAREGIAIDCVRVADWTLANGHSVLAGAALLGPAPHLLLMADHLVDPAIIAAAIAAPAAPLVLAVDRCLENPLVDLDDVTRVATVDGCIRAIGKHLPRYDAFDCGVFKVDGRFHVALSTAVQDGPGSISAGVAALAAHGDARVVDIGDAWWLDVDDPKALQQAEHACASDRSS